MAGHATVLGRSLVISCSSVLVLAFVEAVFTIGLNAVQLRQGEDGRRQRRKKLSLPRKRSPRVNVGFWLSANPS